MDAESPDQPDQPDQAVLAVLPKERTRTQKSPPRTEHAPNFHVIIWNDEEHSFEYVIEMLIKLFNHSAAQAYDITYRVHHEGKAIATTCHRELAELRREQITTYGPDFTVAEAQPVSMRATLEEAPQ